MTKLGPYKQAFEAANPDVEINFVRDSTGVMTARVLAEKDNPRADIIWGLGASSVALFDSMGMLEPYTPKGVDQIKPVFRSTKNPPTWTGMDAWLAVMCYNTVEGGKKNTAEARGVDRSRKPGLQGLDRDAQPGVVGNGLPGGLCVDPAHGRKAGVGVHGQAAPEHRRLHPLRFGALRAGGERASA